MKGSAGYEAGVCRTANGERESEGEDRLGNTNREKKKKQKSEGLKMEEAKRWNDASTVLPAK